MVVAPAYFFYLAEIVEAHAKDLGIDPDLAVELMAQTMRGAGALIQESGDEKLGNAARKSDLEGRKQRQQHLTNLWTAALRNV